MQLRIFPFRSLLPISQIHRTVSQHLFSDENSDSGLPEQVEQAALGWRESAEEQDHSQIG